MGEGWKKKHFPREKLGTIFPDRHTSATHEISGGGERFKRNDHKKEPWKKRKGVRRGARVMRNSSFLRCVRYGHDESIIHCCRVEEDNFRNTTAGLVWVNDALRPLDSEKK